MEEIAVMVKLSTLADHVRSTFCNLDEGGLQRIKENDFICIKKEDLTEEQFKMSPYVCFENVIVARLLDNTKLCYPECLTHYNS